MKYKNDNLEAQFQLLHHKVIEVLLDLQSFCVLNSMPEPLVTHVLRTIPEQVEIYWRNIARDKKLEEKAARALAATQWTWHLVYCAADLRSYFYSPAQLLRIVQYLKDKWKKNDTENLYEILCHNVGSGTHLHVGFRDYPRHKAFLESQKATK